MFSFSKPKASDLRRSFSSATGSARVSSRVEALPKEFFSSLIQNESDFRSNSYTVETLDVLVQLYARAVEYYDNIQDEISSYFTYKIQDILATKRSLKILIDRKEQEKKSQNNSLIESSEKSSEVQTKQSQLKERDVNEIPLQTLSEEAHAEESSDEEAEKSRREWKKKKDSVAKKQTKSLASLKSQRQRFAQFYHQVEVEKNNHKQDMHVLFGNYTNAAQENDQTVKKSIEAQKQKLRQKLQEKKNNTLFAYTLNNTFNSANSFNLSEQIFKRGDFNEDSILRELDCSDTLGESPVPKFKRLLKSQSLFTRKKESGDAKVAVDPVEEVQEQAARCLTPTETPSTGNSMTGELNVGGNEVEVVCREIKVAA